MTGFIGQVGGLSTFKWADGSLTRPNNATAYAANKTIGDGSGSVFVFTDFFRQKGGTALLIEARCEVSKSGGISVPSGIGVRVILFNAQPTDSAAALYSGKADQSAYSHMTANRTSRQGYVDLSTSNTGDASSDSFSLIGYPGAAGLPLQAAANSRDLVVMLVATATWTPTALSIWIPAIRAIHD